eukprot:gene28796-50684_t
MPAAHEGAAKCLESGKKADVCEKELQAACKGLAVGKYCGMKHEQVMKAGFKVWLLIMGAALSMVLAPSGAQTLSSSPAAPPGSGPGVHGAGSPFAPLQVTDLNTRTEQNRIVPVFNASQTALNQKTQRIQGFMMPLEPGEKQRHFLLSSVPLSCSFCAPGGPESMVEVRTKTPVRYGMEPVVTQRRLNKSHVRPFSDVAIVCKSKPSSALGAAAD